MPVFCAKVRQKEKPRTKIESQESEDLQRVADASLKVGCLCTSVIASLRIVYISQRNYQASSIKYSLFLQVTLCEDVKIREYLLKNEMGCICDVTQTCGHVACQR